MTHPRFPSRMWQRIQVFWVHPDLLAKVAGLEQSTQRCCCPGSSRALLSLCVQPNTGKGTGSPSFDSSSLLVRPGFTEEWASAAFNTFVMFVLFREFQLKCSLNSCILGMMSHVLWQTVCEGAVPHPWGPGHNGQSVFPLAPDRVCSAFGIIPARDYLHICQGGSVWVISVQGAETEKPFVGGVCAVFAARGGLFGSGSVLCMCLDNLWGCSWVFSWYLHKLVVLQCWWMKCIIVAITNLIWWQSIEKILRLRWKSNSYW